MNKKLLGVVRLIRPGTTLSGILATVVGAYVAVSGQPDWSRVALAAFVVATIQGAGNTLNDIFDYEADVINKPWRPLPAGKITTREASRLTGALILAGLVTALFLGVHNLLLAIVVAVTLYAYAAFLKQTLLIKNLVVATASALTVVYGAMAVGRLNQSVYLLVAIIFLGILAREILKDMADVDGDMATGTRTVPIAWGLGTAKVLFAVCMVATIAAIALSMNELSSIYKTVALVGVIPFLGYVIYKVATSDAAAVYERLSGWLKFGFFVWFAAILLG